MQDIIGDVHTVYCWTDRPVWPQGIPWPTASAPIPKELDWNLWLGTAPIKIILITWFHSTGVAGGIMAPAHWAIWDAILLHPLSVYLNLDYINSVQASVGSVYVDEFQRGYFPESCPPSSHVIMKFPKTNKTKGPVEVHWMDGGIQPERPEELGAK